MTDQTENGPAGPLQIRYVRLRDAVLWDRNPKRHDMGGIIQSIRLHGFRDAPIYDATLGAIVAGNGRTTALHQMFEAGRQPEDENWPPEGVVADSAGDWWMPMQFGIDAASREQAAAFGLDHNLLTATGGDLGFQELVSLFDHDRLVEVLQASAVAGVTVVSLDPDDLDALLHPPVPQPGTAAEREAAERTLAERFVAPPFSILDARAGYWQARKRAWLALGIQSELGRDARTFGQDLARGEHVLGMQGNQAEGTGTSIFDPVLAEIAYTWFCPPGGSVLDPFAGGSVRGIVASRLGRQYVGIELRPEQVAANEQQAADICRPGDPLPRWIVGDARNLAHLVDEDGFDLVFTCPPYGDLERYSDDPADLSTLPWAQFKPEYRRCLLAALAKLAPDRFAVIVTGDFRERSGGGFYRGFPEYTAAVLEEGGARKYNELVYVTPAGSLPVRVSGQFEAGRKAGKTHQNVHVACKGRPRAAAEACGPVEVDASLEDDRREDPS